MIDLSARVDNWSDEQRMLRDAAADFFVADTDGTRLREWRGRAPGYDRARWRAMAALGWTGLCLTEQYGGSEASCVQMALLLEQSGRALAPEPLTAGALLPASTLVWGDNPALRERWLPLLASGEAVLAVAWQERNSDQACERPVLHALPQGDGYLLKGVKRCIVAGEGADGFIVSATTPQGMALFLVEANAPGLTLRSQGRVDGGL